MSMWTSRRNNRMVRWECVNPNWGSDLHGGEPIPTPTPIIPSTPAENFETVLNVHILFLMSRGTMGRAQFTQLAIFHNVNGH